jgi:hypothetical protein
MWRLPTFEGMRGGCKGGGGINRKSKEIRHIQKMITLQHHGMSQKHPVRPQVIDRKKTPLRNYSQ